MHLRPRTVASGDMTRSGYKSTAKKTVAVRVESLLGSGPQFCNYDATFGPSINMSLFVCKGLDSQIVRHKIDSQIVRHKMDS